MSKQPTKRASKSGPATNPQPREEKKPEAAKADPKKNGNARPPKPPKEPREQLVVFAFRLTPEERDLVHKAAGPAKASRFVRSLVVAGALGDRRKIAALLGVEPPEIN